MTNETKGNLLKIGGVVVGATGSVLGIVGAMVGAKKQYTTVPNPNTTEPTVETAPTQEANANEVVETKTTEENA